MFKTLSFDIEKRLLVEYLLFLHFPLVWNSSTILTLYIAENQINVLVTVVMMSALSVEQNLVVGS